MISSRPARRALSDDFSPVATRTPADPTLSSVNEALRILPAPPAPPTQKKSNPALAADVAASGSRPKRSEKDQMRSVGLTLAADVADYLRTVARRTGMTLGAMSLAAIESSAGDLSTRWASPRPSGERIFAGSETRSRDTGRPVTALQVRIGQSDLRILDNLVSTWQAPSRSALVNEALRIHCSTHSD